ncbi:MAG: flagellar biosynthetic protein FliR [Bacteroidota bacterium]
MVNSAEISLLCGKFLIGAMIFIRILAMMAIAPIFKNPAIITQHKIFLAVILAVGVTSVYWTEQPTLEVHLWYLALLVLKEFMVGFALGFAANMIFYAARFAGGIIDFDMGYQASQMFDPTIGAPTLVGEIKDLATLMLFIAIDGHHYLIQGIYLSMKAVPITTFAVTGSTVEMLISFVTSVFIIAIKMAAPVLVALFATNLALALLARVAPQTNIFILSFQLKVIVGLIVLFLSVPLFVLVTKTALLGMQDELYQFVMTLNPARV